MQREKINEIYAIAFITVAAFIFLGLIAFNPGDLSFYTSTPNRPVKNFAGSAGAHTAGFLLFLMGISAYAIPVLLLIWGVNRLLGTTTQRMYTRIAGGLIFILTASSLASMTIDGGAVEQFRSGGTFGFFISKILFRYCGMLGSYLILFSLLGLSLVLATEFMIFPLLLRLSRILAALFKKIAGILIYLLSPCSRFYKFLCEKIKFKIFHPSVRFEIKKREATETRKPFGRVSTLKDTVTVKKEEQTLQPAQPKTRDVEYTIHKPQKSQRVLSSVKVKAKQGRIEGEYKPPSLDLLDSPPPIEERKIKDDLKTNSEILESTLSDFEIEAKVVRVERGPVITRYELEPAPGIKVSRITNLSDNIALVMKAQSVRIVAPIPGKGTVGVEVPNSSSSLVYFKEVMDSDEFRKSSSKLSLALGKDIAGKSVIADLADMPHLLIAGTTGSGKTVCVNCLVMSLLFSLSPDEVKFLMIDPKMVELAIFNGLPHLLCPVVTDAKKAAASLSWVVNEMENRYKLLAKVGARNIDIFNKKVQKEEDKWSYDDGGPIERLPFIIVIIDELADLMVVARDAIENAITRLAQLSRAVGIHMVLATQRPSVNVVTGVIKANFPARISFKVASKVDSRTVLDMNGADKLLGSGDMLFIEPSAAKPVRAQGSLIIDAEIERIVEYIKAQRKGDYDESILAVQEKKAAGKIFEKDELFDEAVKKVLESRQASVSMLQRKLGLGYTRAARLIDAMEDEGIVGPYRGSKPREILVNTEEQKENE